MSLPTEVNIEPMTFRTILGYAGSVVLVLGVAAAIIALLQWAAFWADSNPATMEPALLWTLIALALVVLGVSADTVAEGT